MKILHTSDWHLGKHLEGKDRIEEQKLILEDIVKLSEQNDIDIVIIAGDIYDSYNPPVKAEKLFFDTVKEITKSYKTIVIAIAGNHDSPEKLTAANSLAKEQGIFIFGTINDEIEETNYGDFHIYQLDKGVLQVKKENETSIIALLPYPSEKRINEVITCSTEDTEEQIDYSQKVNQLFNKMSKYYKEDTINFAVSHLYVIGGEETDSERVLNVGGSLGVNKAHLPSKSQYTALGHFHKPQVVSNKKSAFYSGSILQYSRSEINYAKHIKIVKIKAGQKAEIENKYLNNYKPIELFKCKSISEAIEKCEQNKNKSIWAYFEIQTDRVLNQSEIKKMYELLPNIVEIRPTFNDSIEDSEEIFLKEDNIYDMFKEYYKKTYGIEPEKEVLDMFNEIIDKLNTETSEV